MVEIKLKFNAKSQSANISEAIKIAKKYPYEQDGNFYIVSFDKPDKDLAKLMELTDRLRYSIVYINGDEVNFRKVRDIIFCKEKKLCGGICHHIRIGYYQIDRIKGMLLQKTPYLGDSLIGNAPQFLEKGPGNKFTINKENIKSYISEAYALEKKYCDLYNEEEILKIINQLPNEVSSMARTAEVITEQKPKKKIVRERYRPPNYIKQFNIAKIYGAVIENSMRNILSEVFPDKIASKGQLDPEQLLLDLNVILEDEMSGFYASLAQYEKDQQKIIQYYEKALSYAKTEEEFFLCYQNLGNTYIEFNDTLNAEKIYNQYAEKFDKDFIYLEAMIQIEILRNNKKKAITYLKELVNEVPDELEIVREFPLFEKINDEREVKDILKKFIKSG